MPRSGHVTLNFSPVLLDRMRAYAKAHGMKVNAVVKKAFELLEDFHAGLVVAAGKNGDDDY